MKDLVAVATTKDSMIHLVDRKHPYETACGIVLAGQVVQFTQRTVDCMTGLVREAQS